MVVLLSTTIISCSQAVSIISRIQQVVGLTYQQRTEIIKELRDFIPSCPVKIETTKNDKSSRPGN
jgi:hypothetical protein